MGKSAEKSLYVKSTVREVLGDTRVSQGFLEALQKTIKDTLLRAEARANANGRKTVFEQDA